MTNEIKPGDIVHWCEDETERGIVINKENFDKSAYRVYWFDNKKILIDYEKYLIKIKNVK